MVAVPEWAQELFRAKGIEQVTRAEVVKDTAFHKLVIGYTPTTAVLAEKGLLGSAAYLLPAPLLEAPRPLAPPPALEAPEADKVRAAKPKRKAPAKAKAPRGEVRPRPRKVKRTPVAPAQEPAPEAVPTPASDAEPVPALDLDETRSFETVLDGAPEDIDFAPALEAEVAPDPGPAGEAHREGDFTLHARQQNGRPFYFFARGRPKSGEPSAMPEGYEVAWNERTKTPFLRRKK